MKVTELLEFLNKEDKEIILEQAFCHKPKGCFKAKLITPTNLSPLFPYLRSQTKVLFFKPEEIIEFKWQNQGTFYRVLLDRNSITWGIVSGYEEALNVWKNLSLFLKETLLNLDQIEPNSQPVKRATALEIYKWLPKTNCRDCGENSCLAFAARLSIGEVELSNCPHLNDQDLKNLEKLV